jgi:TatD DNase family protein
LLEIAESTRLPVNLHTRRADSDLLSMAQEFALRTDIPVVIHWFTHSKKLAWKCADAGIFISAGPSIEIDPAQMDVARSIAGDFLLVETDSPVEYAGKPAQPSWTHRIASSLAAARGVDEGELRETLGRNLERYLRPVRKERRSGQSTT